MTRSESALPFWAAVCHLQDAADGRRLDHRAWTTDEQLDQLLNRNDQSDLPPEEVATLCRLPHNRAKKYFNRQQLHADYYSTHPDYVTNDAVEAIDTADDAAALVGVVSAFDAVLLRRVSDGASYDELATEFACPAGTLKARVSRAREAIRQSGSDTAKRLVWGTRNG